MSTVDETQLVRSALRRLNRRKIVEISATDVADEVARHITSRRFKGHLDRVIEHRDLVSTARDILAGRYRR